MAVSRLVVVSHPVVVSQAVACQRFQAVEPMVTVPAVRWESFASWAILQEVEAVYQFQTFQTQVVPAKSAVVSRRFRSCRA